MTDKQGKRGKKKGKKKTNILCTHSGIIGTLCNAANCNGGCVYTKESNEQNDK